MGNLELIINRPAGGPPRAWAARPPEHAPRRARFIAAAWGARQVAILRRPASIAGSAMEPSGLSISVLAAEEAADTPEAVPVRQCICAVFPLPPRLRHQAFALCFHCLCIASFGGQGTAFAFVVVLRCRSRGQS